MKRLLPHPVLSVVLFGLWLLMVNSVKPASLVMAAFLALFIPRVTVYFWNESPEFKRLRPLLRLAPIYVWDLVVANVQVAVLIVSFWRRLNPTWVVVPLDVENRMAIVALANMISLTPGTVSSALTADRLELLVHVLDTDDPEGEVARIKQRYERPLKEIFD